MHTHIYEFDIEKQEIIVAITNKPTINRIGWIFPCIFCSSPTSKIRMISNINGILKSFVCKDCVSKKINNKYCFKHYHLLIRKLKKIIIY